MKRRARGFYGIIFLVCCMTFVVGICILFQLLNAQKVQKKEIEELQLIIHDTSLPIDYSKKQMNKIFPDVIKESETPSPFFISQEALKKLKEKNPDFIGWITIPDTNIDYPVMQSDQGDYYLTHDFFHNQSKYGVPFVDSICDLKNGCDNIIIHGHHMKDGSMFAELVKYKDEAYYQQHPYIQFTTMTATKEFEIISVFQEQFTIVDDQSFLYYRFVKAENSKEYNNYINQVKEKSLYPIMSTANYCDQLLTLSTCDQTIEDGRFIVVAKDTKR